MIALVLFTVIVFVYTNKYCEVLLLTEFELDTNKIQFLALVSGVKLIITESFKAVLIAVIPPPPDIGLKLGMIESFISLFNVSYKTENY